MDHFSYHNGALAVEDVPLADIAARFGTPTYVYSAATLTRHYRVFSEALAGVDHEICYAVKANGNLGVLGLLADMGSGFDIVSVGELERVITAGGDPAKVVFSGVGKRDDEIARALEVGIACFNVESASELDRIDAIARAKGMRAPISLRVNPDVDAKTHPYISTGLKENKFGIAVDEAEALYRDAATRDGLKLIGVDCHIGSQLTDLSPFRDATQRVLDLVDRLGARGMDGSPGGFYYTPAASEANRSRLVIHLEGGGECRTAAPSSASRRAGRGASGAGTRSTAAATAA